MSDVVEARRGRPPRISRDRVVEAAIEIGLDRFSMNDVAAALGVTTPALYTHVESRDDIVRLGAATVLERSAVADVDGADWQEWLRAWTSMLRRDLGLVGGDLLDAIRGGLDMTGLDVADRGLALLLDAGFGEAEAGHVLWLAVRLAFSTGPSGESSVGQVAAAAAAAADAPPSDAMAAAIDAVRRIDNDDAFAFDLDVLIAGLEARLRPE